MFNTRQISILKILLSNEKPITAQQVGSSLNLSARVVRDNIPSLKNWLETQAISLENKPNSGIFIQANANQRLSLLNQLNKSATDDIHIQPKNRMVWIQFELLESGKSLKASNFQHELGISHNTLFKDLVFLEQELKADGLALQRTPGIGISITGSEINYRQNFLSLIREVVEESALLDLFLWRKISVQDPTSEKGILMTKILKTISTWKIQEGWLLLGKFARLFNVNYDDSELTRFVLYISLAYKRTLEGHTIEIPQPMLQEIKKSREFLELQQLMPSFLLGSSIQISDSEIAQLALEVSTAKKLKIGQDEPAPDLCEVTHIAEKLLDITGKEIGYNIIVPEVVKMLSRHLNLSLTRLKHGLPIDNPILEDVEKNFPATIEIVKRAVAGIPELANYQLPPAEIAYISLFIEVAKQEAGVLNPRKIKNVIVVCPTGGITVGMLVLRLKKELPDINVVDILSIRDFNTRDIGSMIDAIITTSPTITHKKVKVICVSPLLSKTDVTVISNLFNTGQSNG